jgi:hypothetical protein
MDFTHLGYGGSALLERTSSAKLWMYRPTLTGTKAYGQAGGYPTPARLQAGEDADFPLTSA